MLLERLIDLERTVDHELPEGTLHLPLGNNFYILPL